MFDYGEPGGAAEVRDRAVTVAELRRRMRALGGQARWGAVDAPRGPVPDAPDETAIDAPDESVVGGGAVGIRYDVPADPDEALPAEQGAPGMGRVSRSTSALSPADRVAGSARTVFATNRITGHAREEGAVLAAPAPIAAVLPSGGVPRGSIVSVGSATPGGEGATSLLLALMAAPAGAWVAAVGLPDLGLLAAEEMGVDFARLGLIPDPGPDPIQVISVLADGVDVIAAASPFEVGRRLDAQLPREHLPGGCSPGGQLPSRPLPGRPLPGGRLPPARERVLRGRLREGGAVLLVAGSWPGADLVLTVRAVRWTGIGRGHGRLRDRDMDIAIGGRRAGGGTGALVTLGLHTSRDAVVMVDVPDLVSASTGTGTPAAASAGTSAGTSAETPAAAVPRVRAEVG